jgi:E3 ubiquitin-protein ligase TRIP12
MFRQLTQTTPEQLAALRQDRVSNVDRERLLQWAAAIVAAIRGRRNPLMIQYAHEAGFGEAVTASFFSEIADAFAFADLGMWYVYGDDAPEEFQSDAAHRLLLASNGLFPQPYCASSAAPSSLLHNFRLLGCMMGKALHDGRAFPLRISYALARCICGCQLRFEDMGAFLSPKLFDCISRLRAFVEGGAEFPSDAVDSLGDFQLFCHVPDADSGRLVVSSLELVPDGRNIDLCEANAWLFLKAFERLFLRDGVALQISSLKDGFYSVVSREAVSILGASGLLRELQCLDVAPFDEEDVKFGLLPVNGYTVDSPQFQWLIKTMLQFDARERATFLRWVKGAPSLPAGFRSLPKRITVQGINILYGSDSHVVALTHTLRFSSHDRFGGQGRRQLSAQGANMSRHDQTTTVRCRCPVLCYSKLKRSVSQVRQCAAAARKVAEGDVRRVRTSARSSSFCARTRRCPILHRE